MQCSLYIKLTTELYLPKSVLSGDATKTIPYLLAVVTKL